jgi:hypothetical protein
MGERVLSRGVDAAFGSAGSPLYSRQDLTQGNRFTLPERTVSERISSKLANEVSRVEDVQTDFVRLCGTLIYSEWDVALGCLL